MSSADQLFCFKKTGFLFFHFSIRGTHGVNMRLFTPRSPVSFPFSFPTFVLLTQMIVRGLWVSGSPRCASCGFPALTKDAEEKLMIEVAKQQLLDKLHLKERPNITQAVPRAALLTALRKLHSGRVRPNRTLEQESNLLKKDQSYEIVSFADMRKSGIHFSCTRFVL